MNVSRLSSALTAIQIQSQAMDRAAARIARSGLEASVDASTDPTVAESMSGDGDLVGATVDGLVAARLFTAAVRLAQTTNENIMAALRIGGYMTEQA